MRVIRILFLLLSIGMVVLGADPVRSPGARASTPECEASKPAARPPEATLIVREAKYLATLAEDGATVVMEIVAESSGKGEAATLLCAGDVAVAPAKLPAGLRLTRDGPAYHLVSDRPGLHRFRVELLARVVRRDPWNQIEFTGPAAAIATVEARATRSDVDVQLASGTAREPDPASPGVIRGVVGHDRKLLLRWQGKAAEAARSTVVTAETSALARVTPAVVLFTTEIQYEIAQGSVGTIEIRIPHGHVLTRVEGVQIRDWRMQPDDQDQRLTVELLKPVAGAYTLRLLSEQPLGDGGSTFQVDLPQPHAVDRQAGLLALAADDMLVEPTTFASLRQVNPPAGSVAAFRFHARPFDLQLRLRRVEPAIDVTSHVSARAEEHRLLVRHLLDLKVTRAGLYSIELSPVDGFTVTDVRGDGIEDWKLRDGRIVVGFSARLLGERRIEVHLERTTAGLLQEMVLQPLDVAGAIRQTFTVGVAPAPGIQLKPSAASGLREVPAASLPGRTDETLAYAATRPDWRLTLSAERLAPRVVAEVFHLVTVGDGIVGGSATVRYAIAHQGLQELRLRLPSGWKNVEFTGPDIRRKDLLPAVDATDTNGAVWSIGLQDKAWGGYTLVVTYDEALDPHRATIGLGGLVAVDAERQTGWVAVTSASGLELKEGVVTEPFQQIDLTELPEADRALISRPVLLAYRQTGATLDLLRLEVTRFPTQAVLDAVTDRSQFTTVLTAAGEMLTQATFMVKNNEKQYQRFELPAGASFWSAHVNGLPVKSEADGAAVRVPLPRGRDRDQAFAVEIVYAQTIGGFFGLRPRKLALAAPVTDIQATFAEWEVYVPATHHLFNFDGNMSAARGLSYGLRDAWLEFKETYGDLFRNTAGLLSLGFVAGLLLLFIITTIRRGWRGALTLAAGLAVVTVLGGMLLPALSKAKSKAQRISAVNNLKQIGLALRLHIDGEEGTVPASLDELKELVGSEKVLTDPESGRRFEYIAAGQATLPPDAIVAYSPVDRNGRAVLLGDGSVSQMSESQFYDALKQSQARWSAEGSIALGTAGGTPASPAPDAAVVGTPPVTAALRSAAAPLVKGVRPVRVEIPRSGRKYTFTKVLNVRDEALTFEALAVNSRVLHTVRGSAQATVFLGGLLLLFLQCRRYRPSAFWLAVSLAAISGSVAHLLLTYRLLGSALILAIPLLFLLSTALLLRRFWNRPGILPATEPTDPVPPTDSPHATPPGTPRIGPAVASLVLLASFLTVDMEAESRPEDRVPDAGIDGVPLESATYTGTVRDHVAHLTAELRLRPLHPKRVIALFGPEVAVESFRASPPGARLLRQGDRLAVQLMKPAATTLTLRLLVPLEGDVTRRRLGFALPGALISRLNVTVNEAEAAVECPAAVTVKTIATGDETRVEAVLGAGDRIELSWTPRIKRAAETAATVFCENLTLATFGGGAVRLRSQLDYQVMQGELGEARILLPPGSRLLRVEGESIRTWQVRDIDQHPTLVVELVKGATTNYRLLLEHERSFETLPATVPLVLPRALAVNRETGIVALSVGDELALSVTTPPELQKIDVSDFRKRMAGTGTPVSAHRFLVPPPELAVRVEPLQPQLTAVTHHRVQLGADQIAIHARIDYTIKHTGVFGLRVALPDDYRVENVIGAGIAQWLEKTVEGSRRLDVAFEKRTSGNYSLQVQLARPLTALPGQLPIVSLRPLGLEKQTGYVVVTPDTGVQARTAAIEGLTEIPAGSVPDGGAGLAFRFSDSGESNWKLEVATGLLDAWVRSELVSHVSLGESLVTGRTQIRYEIQHTPVKELRLRIPAALRHVEVEGPNVRRRERSGDEWIVELQNRAIGTETLTVTWEQPWRIPEDGSETPFDPPAIQTLGVERETGQLVILTRAQLQVDPRTHSAEIIRVDAQEVPDWAGAAPESALLAFRYLRPGYTLTLAARRFARAEALQAVIDDARLTSVVSDDGQMMTELMLMVRNNGRQFLEVGLPGEPNVWSVFVAGQAVRPSVRDGRLLVPLERNLDAPFPIELVYVDSRPFPRQRGQLRLLSPVVDLPIKSARWEVYLPQDYSYDEFAGTMTRETTALPDLRGFTFGDYSQLEVKNRRFLDKSAVDNLDVARRKLASGRVEEAVASYQMAQRFGLKSHQRTNEARELERDLNRALSSNLLQAQREVIANSTIAGAVDAQQRALPAARYDDVAAGQQLARIQQIQEVATRGVQPLRVNLPVRGLRHSFSQLLQIQTGKPLEIRFRAVNETIPNWPARVVWGLCGFLLLWATAAWTIRHTGPQSRS